MSDDDRDLPDIRTAHVKGKLHASISTEEVRRFLGRGELAPEAVIKLVTEACEEFDPLAPGDRVVVTSDAHDDEHELRTMFPHHVLDLTFKRNEPRFCVLLRVPVPAPRAIGAPPRRRAIGAPPRFRAIEVLHRRPRAAPARGRPRRDEGIPEPRVESPTHAPLIDFIADFRRAVERWQERIPDEVLHYLNDRREEREVVDMQLGGIEQACTMLMTQLEIAERAIGGDREESDSESDN
jgi:hypothetical protein